MGREPEWQREAEDRKDSRGEEAEKEGKKRKCLKMVLNIKQ